MQENIKAIIISVRSLNEGGGAGSNDDDQKYLSLEKSTRDYVAAVARFFLICKYASGKDLFWESLEKTRGALGCYLESLGSEEKSVEVFGARSKLLVNNSKAVKKFKTTTEREREDRKSKKASKSGKRSESRTCTLQTIIALFLLLFFSFL